MFSMIIYDILEKAKLWRQWGKKKKQWFPGTRGQERMKRQSTENVEGREIILYDTIIVDTLSKLIEGTTKSKL